MIFDISDDKFKDIMGDENLALPKRWNGIDFYTELYDLFKLYKDRIRYGNIFYGIYNKIRIDFNDINKVCNNILSAVENYFNGFPSVAYKKFNIAMSVLMKTPLKVYQKSVFEQFEVRRYRECDSLNLFRSVKVDENIHYDRKRVFHTPYSLRSKVSTSRYSIAGFPSLYLGTSLELCCEEINYDPHKSFALASMFRLERDVELSETNIRVIELGIKPQDFTENRNREEVRGNRRVSDHLLTDGYVQSSYLLWYPLIAACSFIRTNKKDPFAAEYIIPQLLMQWVRNETGKANEEGERYYSQLIGIRYFSCASEISSEKGFNYVFPTSGQKNKKDLRYCAVLSKSFLLTEPVFIHEYVNIRDCEYSLARKKLDFID